MTMWWERDEIIGDARGLFLRPVAGFHPDGDGAGTASDPPPRPAAAVTREEEAPIMVTGRRYRDLTAKQVAALEARYRARERADIAAERAPERLDATRMGQSVAAEAPDMVELDEGERTKVVDDRALAGVNAKLAGMLAATDRFSNGDIRLFIRSVGIPLDARILPSLNRVLRYRHSREFQQWRRANPGKPYPGVNVDDMIVEKPLWERLRNHAAASAPGTALGSYLQVISGDRLDSAAKLVNRDGDAFNAALRQAQERHPVAAGLGQAAAYYALATGPQGLLRAAGTRLLPKAATAGQGLVARRLAADTVTDALAAGYAESGSNGTDLFSSAHALNGMKFAPLGSAVRAGGQLGRGSITPAGTLPLFSMRELRDVAAGRATGAEKWIDKGFSPTHAHDLAQPYHGMGEHFAPRRLAGESKILATLIDNPLNVLKPRNISKGDFYELHYKVDPKFYGAALRGRKKGGGWSGKKLGLKKYDSRLVRFAVGAPTPIKMMAGAGLVEAGDLGYWLYDDLAGQ